MTTLFKSWEIRMPWTAFDPDPKAVRQMSGSNGVYEIADKEGRVLYIGYAGGKHLFGLRGRIAEHFSGEDPNPAIRGCAYRYHYEITSMWLSRWVELLGRYREEHGGRLPEGNVASEEHIPTLPRFTGALWHEWNRQGTPAEREGRR